MTMKPRIFSPLSPEGRKWSLSEAVQSGFLRPAVNWLITRGWQMAKAGGSHWQAAGTMIECLDADRILFPDLPRLNSADRDFRDNLVSTITEIAEWLCDEQIQDQSPIGYWDGRLYDTSIVVRALLTLVVWQKERGVKLVIARSKIIGFCRSGLSFLEHELSDGNIEDINKIDALSEVLQTLIFAHLNFKKVFAGNKIISRQRSLLDLAVLVKDKLLAKHGDLANKDLHSWDDLGSTVRALGVIQSIDIDTKSGLWDRVTDEVFTQALKALENRLPLIQGEGPSASGFGSYLGAFNINRLENSGQLVNHSLVFFMLHKHLLPGNVFDDGSIFHSLYATNYFVYSLNQVCRWDRAKTPLNQIYSDLLAQGLEHGRLTAEREQIFLLLGETARYKRRIEKLHRETRNAKIILGIVLSITVLISVGLYIKEHGELSNFFQTSFTVFSVILSVLIVTISWLIPGDKREG